MADNMDDYWSNEIKSYDVQWDTGPDDKHDLWKWREFHAFINRHGMAIPIDDGNMEVHHILPVAQGGGDEAQNLVSLCRSCHQKRHKELKEERA